MELLNTKWQGKVTRDTGDSYGLRVSFKANGLAPWEVQMEDGTWNDRTGSWKWQQDGDYVMFGSEIGSVSYRCTIRGFRMSGTGSNMGKRFTIWLDKAF